MNKPQPQTVDKGIDFAEVKKQHAAKTKQAKNEQTVKK